MEGRGGDWQERTGWDLTGLECCGQAGMVSRGAERQGLAWEGMRTKRIPLISCGGYVSA